MCRILVYLFLLLQILSCFATLLRKQDASVWAYPSTLQAYHGLLSFTVHSKPKVCVLSTPLDVRGNHCLSWRANKKSYFCFPFRSVKQRSKVSAPFSEGVTSCLQIMPQLITPPQCPRLNSASKKWSTQGVRATLGWLHIPLFGCPANLNLFLTPALRQQGGHHHPSRAGSPEGADGDVPSGSCQILLWDSAASDDTQPCGENKNIHKCSQDLPSLFF